MSHCTVKRIDEMEAVAFGAFKRARAELGIEAFGAQVMELPPNEHRVPEHDHTHDGQEELYAVLAGGGEIEVEGERHPLDAETMVRVGPEATRKLWPGDQGMRLLIIGGTPGQLYEPPEVSKLGGPDPMADST